MAPMVKKVMTTARGVRIGRHAGRFCCLNLESAQRRASASPVQAEARN